MRIGEVTKSGNNASPSVTGACLYVKWLTSFLSLYGICGGLVIVVNFIAGTTGINIDLQWAWRRGVKFNSPMKAHSTVTAPVGNYRIESIQYTIISNGSRSGQFRSSVFSNFIKCAGRLQIGPRSRLNGVGGLTSTLSRWTHALVSFFVSGWAAPLSSAKRWRISLKLDHPWSCLVGNGIILSHFQGHTHDN